MSRKGTTIAVWFYISEPEHSKALEKIENVINSGLKKAHSADQIEYIAEALQ